MAGSRVFVQEGIHDAVVKKLAEKAKNWVVGDPFDPIVNQGPQVFHIVVIIFLLSSSMSNFFSLHILHTVVNVASHN